MTESKFDTSIIPSRDTTLREDSKFDNKKISPRPSALKPLDKREEISEGKSGDKEKEKIKELSESKRMEKNEEPIINKLKPIEETKKAEPKIIESKSQDKEENKRKEEEGKMPDNKPIDHKPPPIKEPEIKKEEIEESKSKVPDPIKSPKPSSEPPVGSGEMKESKGDSLSESKRDNNNNISPRRPASPRLTKEPAQKELIYPFLRDMKYELFNKYKDNRDLKNIRRLNAV